MIGGMHLIGLKFALDLKSVEIMNQMIKILCISICTFFTAIKITNTQKSIRIKILLELLIMSIICGVIQDLFNPLISTISIIFFMVTIYCINIKSSITHSVIVILISYSINYSFYFIAAIVAYFPNALLNIKSNTIGLAIILSIYIIFVMTFVKLRKFKNGISFLSKKEYKDYIDVLTLNISVAVLLAIVIFVDGNMAFSKSLLMTFLILLVIMFINIQKSLQLYYKQKLLVQELDQTKQELADKKKEVEELEAENIKISKNAHTLSHKQKSLEHKIEEMMYKTEISKEEAAEVRDRLKEIGKDLYKEKITIELDKTGIVEIDDMLKYMQSECKKNKIDFELQLKGNIHHMTNNFITKEDLETLLADHIKNAIIAINHTDNINRSILVRLGKIDETYGLYIYDSGIEFEQETLENLGKKPSTTHANEGGTGMGFMNTFDTLRKCNASLIIEEYNEPSKDNYTKALLIKFDNKNEFKIKSYRTL